MWVGLPLTRAVEKSTLFCRLLLCSPANLAYMNKVRRILDRLLFPAIFLFAAFGWTQAYALADGGGVSAPSFANPLPLPAGWAGLALVLLTISSWLVRKVASRPFFHTTAGAALMGALTAVIPSVIQAVQSHGLQLISIETAILGAVLSFVASDNASNSPAVQAAIVEEKSAAVDDKATIPVNKIGMLLPFIGIAFALSLTACPAHTGSSTGSAIDGGSGSVYTAAFEACLTADGIKLGLSDGSSVLNILDSGENESQIINSLEGLGIDTGSSIVQDLAACAISSWMGMHPVGSAVKPTPAQAAVRVYLARHPALVKK